MIGTVINDRYEILGELGAGGMAQVFKALDKESGLERAVKFLAEHFIDRHDVGMRFEREYLVLARLKHDNIVKVFDYGVLENHPGMARCQPYIAMEYLPYPDLNNILFKKKKIPERGVIVFIRQVASAFAYYHPMGLVHRDLKPSNILVSPKGRPIILDFGLVRDCRLTTLTGTGQVIGTPQFLAPEQLLGSPVDGRTDLHQLGAITYECLTGLPAFDGMDLQTVAGKILGRERKRPTDSEKVGTAWNELVHRCYAREAQDRYPDATYLLRDIDKIISEGFSCRLHPLPRRKKSTVKETSKEEPDRPAAKSIPKKVPPPRPQRPEATSPQGKKSPLGPAIIGFVLTMAILFGSGFFTEAPFEAHDITTQTGPGWFEVRWSSNRPYPSRVCLTEPSSTIFQSETSDRTKKHSIRCSGLTGSDHCTYQILFPNGDRTKLEEGRLAPFQVTPLSAELTKDGLDVRWETPSGKSSMLLLREKEEDDGHRFLATGDHKEWKTIIPHSLVASFDQSSSLTARTILDKNHYVDVDFMKEINKTIDKFLSALKGFHPTSSARARWEAVRAWVESQPSRRNDNTDSRYRQYKKEIEKWLKEEEWLPQYKKMAAFWPILFQQETMPSQQRRELYETVIGLIRLSIFSPEIFAVRSFDLRPLPQLGILGLYSSPQVRADKDISIVKTGTQTLDLTVLPYSKKVTPERLAKRVRLTFTLGSLRDLVKAQLRFEVIALGSTTLFVQVNDAPLRLAIYDRDLLTAKSKTPYAGVDKMVGKLWETAVSFQTLPIQFLKEGENVLELEAASVSYERVTWNIASIRNINLWLELNR